MSLGERGLDALVTSGRPTPGPPATPTIVDAFLPSLRMARGRILLVGQAAGSPPLLERLGIEVVAVDLDGAHRPDSGATPAERVIAAVDGIR